MRPRGQPVGPLPRPPLPPHRNGVARPLAAPCAPSPKGTVSPENKVNRTRWREMWPTTTPVGMNAEVCLLTTKKRKRKGKRCLSAANPGGCPCNSECECMTAEQQLAAGIGARAADARGCTARVVGP
jgi:hypothetical protein